MQRDFKIGMLLGSLLTTAVILWLSTHQNLSIKSRMLQSKPEILEQSDNVKNLSTPVSVRPNVTVPEEMKKPESRKVQATSYEHREARIHVVQPGETLSAISYKYYGTASEWQKILAANRNRIKDLNKLMPGTRLVIPK